MSLSDFPSLVTFKDAAFRLISRWMLLVTQCRICFIQKDYLSDTEDIASTKGSFFFFLQSLWRKKFNDYILSVTQKENLELLYVQLEHFFFPLKALIIFWKHTSSSEESPGRSDSGHSLLFSPSGFPAPLHGASSTPIKALPVLL